MCDSALGAFVHQTNLHQGASTVCLKWSRDSVKDTALLLIEIKSSCQLHVVSMTLLVQQAILSGHSCRRLGLIEVRNGLAI